MIRFALLDRGYRVESHNTPAMIANCSYPQYYLMRFLISLGVILDWMEDRKSFALLQ